MEDPVVSKMQQRLMKAEAARKQKNDSVNESQNTNQNFEEEIQHSPQKASEVLKNEDNESILAEKTTENSPQNEVQNAFENEDEDLENDLDNEQLNDLEEEENAAELEDNANSSSDDYAEDEDPLNQYIQKKPKKQKEPNVEEEEDEEPSSVSTESAEPTMDDETVKENLKNLADLGEMALDIANEWKADLCSAWSGQPAEKYLSKEKHNKALIAAIRVYFSSKQVTAPSPFWVLIIAILAWGAPAITLAAWHKYQIKKKERETKAINESTATQKTDNKNDFSHLKEFKEKRRLFNLHKSKGTYSYKPDNSFWKIDEADEEPSPEIMEMINAGKKNTEIRELLYGE